ncbi:MAG: hypothetical protein PHG04_03650 [Candidatus Nanoarchaeia archaeon]|nr:hypothetical protein [Candidatus Nanoarchaeia archaeon]
MKSFLYLYPIKEYVDYAIMDESFYMDAGQKKDYLIKCQEINDLIDKYFRQKNYKIIYAHFSNSLMGDEGASLSEIFNFHETDNFLDVKINFSDIKKKVYPLESELLESLMPVEKLVVAGFHCHDCVSRFHQEALRKGIDSFLEKSLTEQYFYLIKTGKNLEKTLKKY